MAPTPRPSLTPHTSAERPAAALDEHPATAGHPAPVPDADSGLYCFEPCEDCGVLLEPALAGDALICPDCGTEYAAVRS